MFSPSLVKMALTPLGCSWTAAVIVAIANAEVLSVKDFEQSLAKIDKTKTVNVLFRRGELAQYALIRPGR